MYFLVFSPDKILCRSIKYTVFNNLLKMTLFANALAGYLLACG